MFRISSIIVLIITFGSFISAQETVLPCPALKIEGLQRLISPSEDKYFSVNLGNNAETYDLQYKWEIDKGTIINGQGTNKIKVDFSEVDETEIKVTLRIFGFPEKCNQTISEIGVIWEIKDPVDPYNYGRISLKQEYAELDSLAIVLVNSSDFQAYIIIHIEENETVNETKEHIKKLVKHIKTRNISLGRFTFVIKKSSKHKTELKCIPKNLTISGCEDCTFIEASGIN